KRVSYPFFKRRISLTLSNIFSGVVFLVMGLLLFYYSLTNQITMDSSGGSLWINILTAKLTDIITQFMSSTIGQIIASGVFIILFFWIIKKIVAKYMR
ncbi:MAG: hypothetical protein ACC618_00835, partial [Patescibacteria group bacterium]